MTNRHSTNTVNALLLLASAIRFWPLPGQRAGRVLKTSPALISS